MRVFYFLFLVAFTGAAAVLAYQNQQEVTLTLWNQVYATSVPILVGAQLSGRHVERLDGSRHVATFD